MSKKKKNGKILPSQENISKLEKLLLEGAKVADAAQEVLNCKVKDSKFALEELESAVILYDCAIAGIELDREDAGNK